MSQAEIIAATTAHYASLLFLEVDRYYRNPLQDVRYLARELINTAPARHEQD